MVVRPRASRDSRRAEVSVERRGLCCYPRPEHLGSLTRLVEMSPCDGPQGAVASQDMSPSISQRLEICRRSNRRHSCSPFGDRCLRLKHLRLHLPSEDQGTTRNEGGVFLGRYLTKVQFRSTAPTHLGAAWSLSRSFVHTGTLPRDHGDSLDNPLRCHLGKANHGNNDAACRLFLPCPSRTFSAHRRHLEKLEIPPQIWKSIWILPGLSSPHESDEMVATSFQRWEDDGT